LPPESRNKVLEAYNLHASQQNRLPFAMSSTLQPFAMSASPSVHAPTSPSHLQATTVAQPAVQFVPTLLVPSQSDHRKYEIPIKANRFGGMKTSAQAHFLSQVVNDLMALGQVATGSVPRNRVRSNEEAAQLYLKGKSFVPQKTSFSRFVDPFFECLQFCCAGDICVFQHKHPSFKASTFKGNCKECASRTVNVN
jgi:hypothetical protein